MSKAAAPRIELASADPDIAQEMARWLSHLGAERRLSPKTLEAYARDLRQCLDFLCSHWGERVTLARFAALEATGLGLASVLLGTPWSRYKMGEG